MSDKASSPLTPSEQATLLKIKDPYVTIPRAKYEALMALIEKIAAATLWSDHYGDSKFDRIINPPFLTPEDVRSARALCAAGIPEEKT